MAAAARDVLVTLLGQLPLPFPQACIDAGVASVEADYAPRSRAIPDGRPKTRGIALGQAAAAAILGLRAADGSDTPLLDPAYPQGTLPGEYRFTPGPPVRVRAGLGRGHAVRAEGQLAVPSGSALRGDQPRSTRPTSTR